MYKEPYMRGFLSFTMVPMIDEARDTYEEASGTYEDTRETCEETSDTYEEASGTCEETSDTYEEASGTSEVETSETETTKNEINKASTSETARTKQKQQELIAAMEECATVSDKYVSETEYVQTICHSTSKNSQCGYEGVDVATLITLYTSVRAAARGGSETAWFSDREFIQTVTMVSMLQTLHRTKYDQLCNPAWYTFSFFRRTILFPSCGVDGHNTALMFVLHLTKLQLLLGKINSLHQELHQPAATTLCYLHHYIQDLLHALNVLPSLPETEAGHIRQTWTQLGTVSEPNDTRIVPIFHLKVLLFQLGCHSLHEHLSNWSKQNRWSNSSQQAPWPNPVLTLMEWLRHMDRQIAQAIESHSCVTPTRAIDCRDYVQSVNALFLIKDSKDYQAIKARLFDPTFDIQGRSAHHHPWWSQVQQYIHDIQTCMQMAEKLPSEQAMFDWEKKTLQKCTVCTEKIMSEDDVSMTRLKVDL